MEDFLDAFRMVEEAGLGTGNLSGCIDAVLALKELGVIVVIDDDEIDIDFGVYIKMLNAIGRDSRTLLDEFLGAALTVNLRRTSN